MTLAVSVKQLTKHYPHGITALKGINLDVQEGDFFALLGPNGAGKSTTIGIISSLVTKTSGIIEIFGHHLDKEPAQSKSLIGVVPQEINFALFESIQQILIDQAGYYGIPRRIALQRSEIYLKELGLWTMRNHPAMRLSGGMKRRLMIARALMNHPKLLILDEPTAGVDIELRYTLWHFLKKLNQAGTTIILTTHYLEEAEQLCKHVAIIDHGEIIENATVKSLLSRLDVQTIILELTKPTHHQPNLLPFQYQKIDDSTLEVHLQRGQHVNDLFSMLTEQGLIVNSFRNKTNRLEELFVRLIMKHKAY